MKHVLFLTNFASPYRVHFFDELGKFMDVTVLYSEKISDNAHRDAKWFEEGAGNFRAYQLRKTASRGDENLCLDVIAWLRKPYDAIIVCGYSSPTAMLAIAWLRLHRIPFYMEVDGGLIREDSPLRYRFKKLLVGSASFWLSSGKHTTDYLVHYGADRAHIQEYPFSSLWKADLLTRPATPEEKAAARRELGIPEGKMVLSIGQFIHRKGFDVLMKAAAMVSEPVRFYLVGGEETQEYRQLQKELALTNFHFPGFLKKDALRKYFLAADLFVLPTREDIWGLVINEAMAYGLPVITTDRCVAGLDLIEDGVNGFLVPADDADALAGKLNAVLTGDSRRMGAAALETIRPYTIENMAAAHVRILEGGR